MTNLSNAQLVTIYNSLAEKKITKFTDSAIANKRTLQIVEENAMVLVTDGVADADSVVEDFGFAVLTLKPIVKTRSHFAEEDKISLNNADNPKRKGSLSFARFELYKSYPTIGQYLDSCHKMQGKARYKYLADIRWDLDHGFISLDGAHNED